MLSTFKKIVKDIGFYSSMMPLYGIMLLFLMAAYQSTPFIKQPVLVQAQIPPRPIPEEVIITSGIPDRLIIPALSIDMDLQDGTYLPEQNAWTLSPRGAHYATMTAQANDHSGNTFIYGHNNKHVFGPLKNLLPGQEVQIITKNGLKFTYSYERSEALEPEDTSVLGYTEKPQLTLQTCSGNWNEKREMYYMQLKEVKEV